MSIRKRNFTLFRPRPSHPSASPDEILPLRRAKLGRQSTTVAKSIFAFGCGLLAISFILSLLRDDFFSGTPAGSSIQQYGGGQDMQVPDRIGDNNTSIAQQVGSDSEQDTPAHIGDSFGHLQGLIAHPSNYPPTEGNYTEFLGFLRIAKTASTSVMQFISDPKDGLYNLNSFLQTNYKKGDCIFASISEDVSRPNRNVRDCGHGPYKKLKSQWYKSLPLLDVEPSNTQHRYYFHPFSMVRDPFDRMVSFFYYMQETIPHWSLSEQQDEKILADDFFGWWKVLVQEKMDKDSFLAIPYMYEAFGDDLDTAIDLISGDSPEIMITSSDCVDMSLRLLSTLKPQFFAEERVEDFLHSTSNHARARDKSSPKNYFNQTLAREMHKEMFPEDWKFYNAALKQMKRTLMETNLKDRFEDDYSTCMDKLDSKITESGVILTAS